MQTIPIWAGAVSIFVLKPQPPQTRILLIKRAEALYRDRWFQVAGRIEPGELAWQAALRELKEETNLTPDSLYSADICEQFYEVEQERLCILPVFVAMVRGDAAVTLNHEHSDYRWMSVAEAEQLLPFAGQRRVLRHVHQEFIRRPPPDILRIPL